MAERQSFVVYHRYQAWMLPLSDAEVGRLFRAMLEYSIAGDTPALSGAERYVFPAIQEQMDRDKEQYEATCAVRAEAGRRGGQANASFAKQNEAKQADTDTDTDTESDTDSLRKEPPPGGGVKKRSAPRFAPPTIEEVEAYAQEAGLALVDAAAFIDTYAQQGWRLSNGNTMKDWHAACRQWNRREELYQAERRQKQQPKQRQSYDPNWYASSKPKAGKKKSKYADASWDEEYPEVE